MRKAITFLQSCARLQRKDDESLTQQDVREIAGVIPDDVIAALLDVCRTNSYERVERFVEVSRVGGFNFLAVTSRAADFPFQDLMLEGHSAVQIITQLHDVILDLDELQDRHKSAIMERLAVS